jgi:hypothetical protein
MAREIAVCTTQKIDEDFRKDIPTFVSMIPLLMVEFWPSKDVVELY